MYVLLFFLLVKEKKGFVRDLGDWTHFLFEARIEAQEAGRIFLVQWRINDSTLASV